MTLGGLLWLLLQVSMLASIGLMLVIALIGDKLVTLAARKFGKDYVGDKIEIAWSLRDGSLAVRAISLGRPVMDIVTPMLGMPMDVEKLQLGQFRLVVPLVGRLFGSSGKSMQSLVEIADFQLGLSVNDPVKWATLNKANADRFKQAVADAAKARIARVDSWTAAIAQKLALLASARIAASSKTAKPTPTAKTSAPPKWQVLVDEVIDSFAIVVRTVSITVRDDHSASGIGVTLEKFEIGRSAASDTRRKRIIQLSEFAIFVNTSPHSRQACYVLKPMTMEIQLFMPFVMQSLLMQQIDERRALNMQISFHTDLVVQFRPAQLSKLMKLLRPLAFHAEWHQRALVEDESACVELSEAERNEYMALYKAQWEFENMTGLPARLIAGYRQKEELQSRQARLDTLQVNTLASALLLLRSRALQWSVPSGGTSLPSTSIHKKQLKDLKTFMASPLDKYVKLPDAPPMFHTFSMSLALANFELQLMDDSEQQLLTTFANDMAFSVDYALEKVSSTDIVMGVALKLTRFGILDERNLPSNVFRRLLDRNPGAVTLMDVQVSQLGNGHLDLRVTLKDLSLLVIFDPLLATVNTFLPALEEDEASQMKYLAYSNSTAASSQEQTVEAQPVYKEDVPQVYSPLLFGGMSLRCVFTMTGCEICLLGDSTSMKTHVLAFTSDTTLQAVSSAHYEAVELELVDVALQPCTIGIIDDGIEMELAGLRTILELEGEGVDLHLGYKLIVGDPKKHGIDKTTSEPINLLTASKAKSGANLWKAARKAVSDNKIVETDHIEAQTSEQEGTLGGALSNRIKASARRRFILTMADFAMNLSANDVSVFLRIISSLSDAMKEDVVVIKERKAKYERLAKAKKELHEQQYMERLKTEFQLRDVDGGGSLDVDEIEGLITNVVDCMNLTKDEFDDTVREFISIVDRDGSGDISLEEFEDVLSRNKTVYHHLHHGVASLTGQEYVDSSRSRNTVPYLTGHHANELSNTAALAAFWGRYESQVGASKTSLNGIPAAVVQKKMVRTFKNYEFAQEAWIRIVNPSLVKPVEHSSWLLSKEMDMGSRGSIFDQLLSSFDDQVNPVVAPTKQGLHLFVHTIITTSFGGFYLRLIDETLPMGLPSIEVSLEDLVIRSNYSAWEGDAEDASSDLRVRKRAQNNYGTAQLSFAVYGKYYNTKSRQVEPFLEYFKGVLEASKEPETHMDIVFSSDHYFQLNVTFSFMEVVNANMAAFSKVGDLTDKARPHIKEEGGLFWMLNETGVNVKYYVVAKKQVKERVRAETVTSVASVPSSEAHPCVLLSVNEEMKDYEQQHLKEKQLRQAFRNADADNSGELDTNEVRAVLLEVYEEEFKLHKRPSSSESSTTRRSDSVFSNDADFDASVNDFIAMADTDGSGQVSWEEFKIAISKSRETINRFISLEVEGYEPVHDIPISSFGQTQVYELVPFFEDVDTEPSIAALYQLAVSLLNNSDTPTKLDMHKAYACLRRVKSLDPDYEWVDSYYRDCMRRYVPALVAVDISVDGFYGLQVKAYGAVNVRNDTAKRTECLMVDENGEVSTHNPVQHDSKERFCVIPPEGSFPIPLDLVDRGSFAIRQVGETDWSNFLPLSVREQRLYKNLSRYEQKEAKRSLRHGDSTISSSRMVTEKMGKDIALPTSSEIKLPGMKVPYPSTSVIDNQPTLVIETVSSNDMNLSTWAVVIQPQLILDNVLPCGVEYAIVQAQDCPADMLDAKGQLRVVGNAESSKSSGVVKVLGDLDYFQYVNEVNSRKMYVESGKSAQVFGLDLEAPALLQIRLCASASNRAGKWSSVVRIHLNAARDVFNTETFDLCFADGPNVVYQQEWPAKSARKLTLFAPFWIQNRSGLDLRFRLPKGNMCTIDQHRAYFNNAKEIPLLVNAPQAKALISVKPFQETARSYESGFLQSRHTKKYLPLFEKADWSEAQDMASVGTNGELCPSHNHSFVLAYEVLAAPEQFFRSKIFRISPRFVLISHVPRPLHVTPLMLDKKLNGTGRRRDEGLTNVGMQNGDKLVVYHFVGSEKHKAGLRLRDVYRDEALQDVGPWSPGIPVVPGDNFNVWTRGPIGDGPACNLAFQTIEETIYGTLTDISSNPRYRIENRSTRHSFRYIQRGVKGAEEVVIKPLETHSFVWENPMAEDKRLKVTPLNWKIPTEVDFMRIGIGPQLLQTGLFSEVYIDGSARVFAVGDAPVYAAVRRQAALSDWLSNILIDVAVHGVGITIVDASPREVMNITMEDMRFSSKVGSRACTFSLHHMQIDDMTADSLYPVVLAPVDSGYNSDKREGWLPKDGERPFVSLTIDTSPQSGITIVNDFSVELHSTSVKLNLEYILGLVNLLLEFIPSSDAEAVMLQGIANKNATLTLDLNVPEHIEHDGGLMYFKKWWMSPYELHLVFDSSAEDRGEGITSILGSTLGSIVGGIAHVTPEFSFNQILYENRFFYTGDLVYEVVLDIVFSVVRQWYKIVGSVEMLGDPVGLATDLVDGFALAARQLKRDVKGKSIRKGESALTLAQTVVGAPMRSIGKISNGLGDVLKKSTAFENQEEDDQPRHLPEGFLQGGIVFSKSLAYGVKGFVNEPMRGAKRQGAKGFAKGVGRGTLQLVASPFVGTLGVVEKLSHSVNNTTHLLDEKSFDGTRRPARDLIVNPLKALSESNVITEVEFHVLSIDGLPDNSNPQVVIRVYHQPSGGPAKDLAKCKTSTMHHTGTPKYDQSWLIGIASTNTFIEVNVYHKRKPMRKKLLGRLVFSMEDIYREFEGVPANIFADATAKFRLKKRKRFHGSILNDLASSNAQPAIEIRDESWRQKATRPSMANFLSDELDEDDDDDVSSDAMLLTAHSIQVNSTAPIKPVGLVLEGSETNAKIYLSVRYVNDMRRYA